MNNRIPRKFYQIAGEMLINTNMTQAGDVLHIYKNNSGYLALNTRTGKYFYTFVSMLRNSEIFRITKIVT